MNPPPRARQRKIRTVSGASPSFYYVYHWNRIIGALVALALLIGVAGFALHAWLAPANTPTSDAETGTPMVPAAHPEHTSDIVAEPPLAPTAHPEPAPEPVAPYREAVTPELAEPEPLPAPDEIAEPAAVAPLEDVSPTPAEAVPPSENITSAPIAAAEPSEAQPSRVFLPPDTRVNLRAAPSLTSPVLRILDDRAELQLLGTAEAFFQVRTAERIVGWVSRDYSSLAPYSTPDDRSGNTN